MSDLKSIEILLTDIHKVIEEYSQHFVKELGQSIDITYPPGIEPEENIKKAFSSISLNETQKEALKLAVMDLNAQILFDFFSKMDGVADPEFVPNNDLWFGVELKEKNEQSQSGMLHDQFYEKYWPYKESKT